MTTVIVGKLPPKRFGRGLIEEGNDDSVITDSCLWRYQGIFKVDNSRPREAVPVDIYWYLDRLE